MTLEPVCNGSISHLNSSCMQLMVDEADRFVALLTILSEELKAVTNRGLDKIIM